MSVGRCRVGTSGFQYDHWREILYPPGLPKRAWLERYAEVFDTVEVNATFYRVPRRAVFAAWRDRTPPGFGWSLKFSGFGTHRKKLRDPGQTIGYFLERAEPLLDRVLAILVQLPPRWSADPDRLDAFLAHAPRSLRWAVEVRDPSWLVDGVYDVLRAHRAALCLHDALEDHPWVVTTDWLYLRFHGGSADGTYDDAQLGSTAEGIRAELDRGRDVLAYFNNDLAGHAVGDARRLLARVRGGAPADPDTGGQQGGPGGRRGT